MTQELAALRRHQRRLSQCTRCPKMQGPVVIGGPVFSPVLLVGQAPGDKEIVVRKPFAWTAGKTMFKWFQSIGLEEEAFRSGVYMAAVCRCFPGKNPKGGDRVPGPEEIANCSSWLQKEVELLQPELVLPVGKLAIAQLTAFDKLVDVVGAKFRLDVHGVEADVIPLPHPSGASTWHRMEPGKTLLGKALGRIQRHPAWKRVLASARRSP
ncbi:MAG: uracil-DNA glycosylase [Acidobacteria bacterium]|nr:MAG: uracil-DNA glycosylase [Acidobacteriota bacterium]